MRAFGPRVLWTVISLSFVLFTTEAAQATLPRAFKCEGINWDPVKIKPNGKAHWLFAIARKWSTLELSGQMIQMFVKEGDQIIYHKELLGDNLTVAPDGLSARYEATSPDDPWTNLVLEAYPGNQTRITVTVQGVTGLNPNLTTRTIAFQIGSDNFSALSSQWYRNAKGAWRLDDIGVRDTSFCETLFVDDPAYVRWGRNGKLDIFHVAAGIPYPEVTPDMTQKFTMKLLGQNKKLLIGHKVAFSKFTVSSSQQKPTYTYKNEDAQKNGGIFKISIDPHKNATMYIVQFTAYGRYREVVEPTQGLLEIWSRIDSYYYTPLHPWKQLERNSGFELKSLEPN